MIRRVKYILQKLEYKGSNDDERLEENQIHTLR